MGKLHLVIADKEKGICDYYASTIELEKLNLEIVGIANNGQQLLNIIDEKRPEIVITSIGLPEVDGIEVIRTIREHKTKCRFIIITEQRDFDLAVEALKLRVDDYLIKPADARLINNTLEKIVKSIHKKNKTEYSTIKDTLHALFINKGLPELKEEARSIEEINKKYNLDFVEGFSRHLFIKFDYTDHKRLHPDAVMDIIDRIHALVNARFGLLCADIVYQGRFDGLTLMLNYLAENDQTVKNEINLLFRDIKESLKDYTTLGFTICVSAPVDKPSQFEDALDQARTANWSRMGAGINRVIFHEDIKTDQSPSIVESRLNELEALTLEAIEILDISEFEKYVNKVFELPEDILCSADTMNLMRKIRLMVKSRIDELVETEDVEEFTKQFFDMVNILHLSTTFSEYKDNFLKESSQILKDIIEEIDKKNMRPIRLVHAYVEKNFHKQIMLEELAQVVNLSPVYLSNLFKKITGQNITDYIVEYKMKKARQYLVESNLKILEIANSLGFIDVCYFSRIFKKKVGINPSEYRKMYG